MQITTDSITNFYLIVCPSVLLLRREDDDTFADATNPRAPDRSFRIPADWSENNCSTTFHLQRTWFSRVFSVWIQISEENTDDEKNTKQTIEQLFKLSFEALIDKFEVCLYVRLRDSTIQFLEQLPFVDGYSIYWLGVNLCIVAVAKPATSYLIVNLDRDIQFVGD